MKTLYLTRHGETMFNVQHRIQGWCDSPLTERGRAQARQMGAILRERGVHIDAACCSTAERAADTLELLLHELGAELPYARLKDLREMFYGDLEAQQDFLAQNDPEACRTYYLQFGGESSDTVRDRMIAALTSALRDPGVSCMLAVGHGGANFNFLRGVLGTAAASDVLAGGWGNLTTCVYTFDETRADEVPDGAGAGPWQLADVIRLP